MEVKNSDRLSLQESMSRFFLWGASFHLDALEEPRNNFEDLRIIVVELLIAVGRILVQGQLN